MSSEAEKNNAVFAIRMVQDVLAGTDSVRYVHALAHSLAQAEAHLRVIAKHRFQLDADDWAEILKGADEAATYCADDFEKQWGAESLASAPFFVFGGHQGHGEGEEERDAAFRLAIADMLHWAVSARNLPPEIAYAAGVVFASSMAAIVSPEERARGEEMAAPALARALEMVAEARPASAEGSP